MSVEAWGMRSLPTPPLPQVLGTAIREIRVERGLSQEQAALAADVDRSYYGHLERGGHKLTIVTLWKIADGLGVKPATIIRRAERHMQDGP